jgi:hypothetical protein
MAGHQAGMGGFGPETSKPTLNDEEKSYPSPTVYLHGLVGSRIIRVSVDQMDLFG